MSLTSRNLVAAAGMATLLTLAGCSGTTSTGGATSTATTGGASASGEAAPGGTTTPAPSTTTIGGDTVDAPTPGQTTTPGAPTSKAAPQTTQTPQPDSPELPAAVTASAESVASYVRTALTARDPAKVKAAMTEKGAANVDRIIDSIPVRAPLQAPKCSSAGNSIVMHCTMMVDGFPFAVELGVAKNPKTGAWQGTSLSYDSTN